MDAIFALGVVTLWFIPKLIISGSTLAPVFGDSIVLADAFLLVLLGAVACFWPRSFCLGAW